MSDSRLEKFIYAICSMEVSDLPVPLSRIEKLWNCLITGETPDFEPLSRNEKYLMAMLDRYDISNLPAPMSRGEKLLYKIAVGETDLSDVPGYLSRYEELLKYLIENGGINGGDFEYVLYTLNQSLSTLYTTVEKPIKSAILSGNTLVNLGVNTNGKLLTPTNINYDVNCSYLEVGKTYYVIVKTNSTSETGVRCGFVNNAGTSWDDTNNYVEYSNNKLVAKKYTLVKTKDSKFRIQLKGPNSSTPSEVNNLIEYVLILEYQQGMENWDIPYFTGMQSVKMPVLTTTGKNLFDKSKVKYNTTIEANSGQEGANNLYMSSDFISVKPNENYISNNMGVIFFYDENKQHINSMDSPTLPQKFTTPVNCKYIRVRCWEQYGEIEKQKEIVETEQIEQGTQATSYEPYKSNILTVNEDITLRKVGDVQDTLDGLTGELTKRLSEVVLDGSENWSLSSNNPTNTDLLRFTMKSALLNAKKVSNDSITHYLTDKFEKHIDWNNMECAWIHYSNSRVNVVIKKDKLTSLDANGFQSWLSLNPITVQYQLETESTKTIDLSTVDQDGQPTTLKTFNDISYVEINSDNIIPSVDVEVATKISETLATLDPQQNDISNTQNQLSQTIDEQSENTDATMMATTEIYEQTL